MAEEFGRFPFGKSNSTRPMREADGQARTLIVGVYPSAWHVAWTAPAFLTREQLNPRDEEGDRRRTGGVRALAVDVEPTVFWNGDAGTFDVDVEAWRQATGFIEGDEPGTHGHIDPKTPGANGSTGKKVDELYLAPLCISAAEAAFTDIYPTFVVKYAGGKRREQGDAIEQEYDAVARNLAMPKSSIPKRPLASKLPGLAVTRFGDRIVADFEAADAPLVVTLGEEAFQTLMKLPQLGVTPPQTDAGNAADSLVALYNNGYGNRGTVQVNGRTVEWLPLAHPGLLKGEPDLELVLDSLGRTGAGWNSQHANWAARSRGEN